MPGVSRPSRLNQILELRQYQHPSTKCPHCGVGNPAASPGVLAFGALLTVGLLGGMVWYLFLGGLEKQAAGTMRDITAQVAGDAVDQYQIAAKSGTDMDKCVQAGFVVASFLQAKDDSSYAKWQTVQAKDCAAAGVSR
jgi:hypothetical protein